MMIAGTLERFKLEQRGALQQFSQNQWSPVIDSSELDRHDH